MPIYSFFHRWTRDRVASLNAPTYSRALELAVRKGLCLVDLDLRRAVLRSAFLAGADLRGAELSGADLCGGYLRNTDLRGADLRGAQLTRAFLRGADLRQAGLRGAVLTRADLRGASLLGADLRSAILTGARLNGAVCDWRWSVIPAELLRQHPETSGDRTRLVVEMAFQNDSKPWSWLELLSRQGNRAGWALEVLAHSVRDDDNSPQLLRRLSAVAGIAEDRPFLIPRPFAHAESSPGLDREGDCGLNSRLHELSAVPASSRVLWIRRRLNQPAAVQTISDS
jgi:hypothetical protein